MYITILVVDAATVLSRCKWDCYSVYHRGVNLQKTQREYARNANFAAR